MNDRIDHVAEALVSEGESRESLARMFPDTDEDAGRLVFAVDELKHAALALVEQQRIANLIEYMRLVNSDPSQAVDLTPKIAAALGVDQS